MTVSFYDMHLMNLFQKGTIWLPLTCYVWSTIPSNSHSYPCAREYLVRMKLHYVEAQSATRKELWSLKPYQWISSCVRLFSFSYFICYHSIIQVTLLCLFINFIYFALQIINLIVVKLTNKQRKKFPNKDHKVWYFPTHVSVSISHT